MNFVLIKAATGRIGEIMPTMWVCAALSVVILITAQ